MITKATVLTLPIMFGANLIFKGHFMQLFLVLFFVLFILDLVDILTRLRVERIKKNIQSEKLRAGIRQRVSDYLTLMMFSIILYFVLGSIWGVGSPHSTICTIISAIPATIVIMYVLGILVSILENGLAYSEAKGIRVRYTTKFFIKILGILQGRIGNKLLEKLNEKEK